MLTLAVSSLRFRTATFLAIFVNVLLGAAILMAFASLFDTADAGGLSSADRSSVTTIAWVVGGWGALIVAFGVASTLNLSVRQRETELALLRSAGATPGQVGRMIVGEAAIVSAAAAVLAIPAGWAISRYLVHQLVDHHVVAASTQPHFGWLALGVGLGDTFVAASVAALISARRASRLTIRAALTSAAVERRGLGWKRLTTGCVFLLIGVDVAALAATVFDDGTYLTEALAGEACIWTGVGFAFLAPSFVRAGTRVLRLLLRPFSGVSGYLADLNVRQRSSQTAGVLIPLVLFIGLGGGSLGLQDIQNHALSVAHRVQTADDKGLELVNLTIVGLLAVFTAVVLINIAIATTVNRQAEFGQQRLIGSTRSQVLRMVFVESAVTTVTGLVLGAVAAAAGTVAFSIALSRTAVPHVEPGTYLGVAVTAVLLTFLANLGAAGRAVRRPALAAVAGAGT